MRIGIDFDNTIVSYDGLFYRVAREQGLVPEETPVNKVAVRDHLRNTGREDLWTEMQGYVYGARMDEALAYPGVIDFFRSALEAGHELAIVSHKTRHPFMGPSYDLHQAAMNWIYNHLVHDGKPLIPEKNVFFELTKPEKIQRIGDFACDAFIDDLPEILQFEGFPAKVERLLFDPEDHYAKGGMDGVKVFRSWDFIKDYLMCDGIA